MKIPANLPDRLAHDKELHDFFQALCLEYLNNGKSLEFMVGFEAVCNALGLV